MTKVGFTIALVLAAVCHSYSQTEKGNFMIGGSMGFQSSYTGSGTLASVSLAPTGSYFFFDRFAAGLTTGWTVKDGKASWYKSTSNETVIGPTVRYYFPISSKWSFFPQLEYTFIQRNVNTIDLPSQIENPASSSTNSGRLGIGATYFLAENVGVESILYTPLDESLWGPNLHVGLQVYTNRKLNDEPLPNFSRTSKGSFMIGGSMSWGTSHSDYPTYTSSSKAFSITPSVSYFFLDRLAAGLVTTYSNAKTTYSYYGSNEITTTEFSVGPAVRYYFPFARRWALYPNAEYRFKYYKLTESFPGSGFELDSSTGWINSIDVGAGITYFIARNVGIEALYQIPLATSSTIMDFRISLQVYVNP